MRFKNSTDPWTRPQRRGDAHRMAKHGPLLPLDERQFMPGWAWLTMAAVLAPFVAALVMS